MNTGRNKKHTRWKHEPEADLVSTGEYKAVSGGPQRGKLIVDGVMKHIVNKEHDGVRTHFQYVQLSCAEQLLLLLLDLETSHVVHLQQALHWCYFSFSWS